GEHLDRLHRHGRADHPAQHSEHPGLGAAGHLTGLRRHRVHVAVGHPAPARPPEHADLAGEGEDRAPEQRDVEDLAGVGGARAASGVSERTTARTSTTAFWTRRCAAAATAFARPTSAVVNSTWRCRFVPSTVSGSKSVISPTPAAAR